MAGENDPSSRDAASQPSFRDAVYGSIKPPRSAHDSVIDVSPTDTSQRDFPPTGRYYIYPPIINGHGRLVIAHRTVPHLAGCLLVVGTFVWGVCAALYAYPLLGGHSHV
ncbi:hypothetical protein P3342_011388 [Pyrenophora teres f. teres]|uniref:Uncharacterized protein n=1 Tax=Pyrenophora teres f. teres (strain 0-1) TaxID=861557 RepID=E3RPY1_PYRTT|nr:hypothetical protein PTT_10734 [Pyrenophora teres f. teres 0-1]KAK1909309.1 hypothetical protein P3342_011388 [Pyrenophora teres f. teres]